MKLRMAELQGKGQIDAGKTQMQIEGNRDITQMKIDAEMTMQDKELMQGLAVEKMNENITNKQMKLKDREYK